MEFCSMEKQPMPLKKKLPDDAIAKMIRATAVKPEDRQKKIIDGLKKKNAMYRDDPYAREFGINDENVGSMEEKLKQAVKHY